MMHGQKNISLNQGVLENRKEKEKQYEDPNCKWESVLKMAVQ